MAVNAGWNQFSKVLVKITAPLVNTINLTSGMSFPRGLEIYVSPSTRVGGVMNGGDAITTAIPVTIDNQGTICGGGGAGGQGGYGWISYNDSGPIFCSGGAGGAGQGFYPGSLSISFGAGGEAGTYAEYNGPVFGGDSRPWCQGGTGGTGGSWGGQGTGGYYLNTGGSYHGRGEAVPSGGQAPGCYVRGNNYVTWKNTGSRAGNVIA